ncbi:MAG TPA: hypothetical protein VEU62_23985 [Bryobacterales bacterium]|nr:hypothetical protein [Bryobacterales bacterium]
MGPINYPSNVGLPVEPAERAAAGDFALQGDKDRRRRQAPRRRHHENQDPDADQFTHQEEKPPPDQ